MPRPRQVSDEEICSAVRKGVLEQGPFVSLELVAERLGVTAPALFKRFGSRNALLISALKLPERPRFIELLERGPEPRQPLQEQLTGLIDAHMQFVDEAWPCMAALRESGIPKEQLKQLWSKAPLFKAVKLLSMWLEKARRLGIAEVSSPEQVAMALLGAGQMPVMIRHMSRLLGGTAPSIEGHSKRVAQLFARGLLVEKKRV